MNPATGGIGRDEAQAFRRAGRHYPLALEFANKAELHDEFTAGAKVLIRGAKGATILETVAEGPFLPANVGFLWPARAG